MIFENTGGPGVLDVDLDRLRTHTRHVGEVEADVAEAAAAARHLDLHDGAFGVLCAFLPTALAGVAASAQDALTRAEGALDDTVEGLLAMDRSYRAVDDATSDLLRRLLGSGA